MKKTLIFAFSLASFLASGQANNSPEETPLELKYAAEGSFEVISKDKIQELFTTDVLIEIESRRHATKYIDWDATEYSIIRIFPKSVLNSTTTNH